MRFFVLVPAIAGLAIALTSCSSSPSSDAQKAINDAVTSTSSAVPPPPAPDPYLEKAAAEPGAKKTASGLVFKTLKPGSGASPKATDTVKVNYRGTLTNGTEFDSSYKRNEPTTFPLNMVIPCWTEGVQLMKVGEKAQLVCPAAIAYGPQSPSPLIPPNSTLVFEIELLSIGG